MLLRPGCRRWRHCRRPVECVSSLPSRRSVEWHWERRTSGAKEAAEKVCTGQESKTPGAKAQRILNHLRPDKSRALIQSVSFSAACKALIRRTVLGATKVVP